MVTLIRNSYTLLTTDSYKPSANGFISMYGAALLAVEIRAWVLEM